MSQSSAVDMAILILLIYNIMSIQEKEKNCLKEEEFTLEQAEA